MQFPASSSIVAQLFPPAFSKVFGIYVGLGVASAPAEGDLTLMYNHDFCSHGFGCLSNAVLCGGVRHVYKLWRATYRGKPSAIVSRCRRQNQQFFFGGETHSIHSSDCLRCGGADRWRAYGDYWDDRG